MNRAAPAKPGYRADLQGLRAVAIGLVVVYHVWFGRVSGGIDVFFVLSGFLVTMSLLRRYESGRGIAPLAFWGRVAQRLWPAAMLVLLATIVATWLWLPETRWEETLAGIVASALYYENWHLAALATDYLAVSHGPSPVQHYWSMSIQGQIYLVWPILLLGVVGLVKPWSPRIKVAVLMTTVFAASLAYSVWLTDVNQPLAYFSTFTRVWEFALGGLLAAGFSFVTRVPDRAKLALGWIGLVAITICGLVITGSRVFPGYASLWPTLAAVAVIVGGTGVSRYGVGGILSSRPATAIGDLAYPLYLWHWPILVFFLVQSDKIRAGLLDGAAVIALSLVLAFLTRRFVERPLSGPMPGRLRYRGAPAFAAMLVIPIALAIAWSTTLQAKHGVAQIPAPELKALYPGAKALKPGVDFDRFTSASDLVPSPIFALDDHPPVVADGCMIPREKVREDWSCTYGDENSDTVITIVGSSMAAQWTTALIPIAERQDWKLVTFVKSGCQLSVEMQIWLGNPIPSCDQWNVEVIDDVIELQPDLTIVISSRALGRGPEALLPGGEEQWAKLSAAGLRLAGLRTQPVPPDDPAECVLENGPYSTECGVARADVMLPRNPARDVDVPGWETIDLTDHICEAEWCPAVVGNVLVYRDIRHLSASYVRSLRPALEHRLVKLMRE